MLRDENMEQSGAFDGIGLPDATEFTRTRADLERWNAGDQTAFGELWRRYRPALHVLVAGQLRTGLRADLRARLDVEDVLQNIAIVIHEKLDAFDYRGQGSLMAWMTQIARNAFRDHISYWQADKRHADRERPPDRAIVEGTETFSGLFLDSSPGPATTADQAERIERVTRAMASLSERHHTILFWRFFGGAQWEEIARKLKAPSADAVRMECFGRALPALAAALPRRGDS
jgi:RNA polymerase sigma factor (sigma-70 family)